MIKRLLLLVGMFSINACCVLAEDTGILIDPVEIIERADVAARAVKVAQYEAKAFSISATGKSQLVAEGKATIEGFAGEAPQKFTVSGSFNRRGSKIKHDLVVGSDGENVYLIDAKTKTAYVGFDFDVLGSHGELLFPLLMAEYVVASPFSDELRSEKQELIGTTKVGDEECYEVLVQYSDKRKTRWFFSVVDFLPRRVDRLSMHNRRPTRGTRLVVTSLKTNPKLEKNPYKFKLPLGFELSDDYAP